MLILQEPRLMLLHEKPRHEWREPSQRSTLVGIENRTWFKLEARTSDGLRFWRGWFEDWADADAFVWALVLHQQTGVPIPRDIRRLPQASTRPHTFVEQAWCPALYEGEWREEWAELPLLYEKLAVTSFLTSPTGSNQTWTSPSDWNNADNSIRGNGGGGSGGNAQGAASRCASGAGGASYSEIANFVVATPGTTQATARVGAGGPSVQSTGSSVTNGNDGGVSWFNDTVDPGAGADNAKWSARPGLAGAAAAATSATGGAGGVGTSGYGQTRRNGGNGGTITSQSGRTATGGGGAAGPTGTGSNAAAGVSNTGTNGGAANGSTTAGGAGGSAGSGSPGSDSNEYGSTNGPGSGGGGGRDQSANDNNGGAGGDFGGGGGAVCNSATNTLNSGAGAPGIIVITYTPVLSVVFGRNAYQQAMLVR